MINTAAPAAGVLARHAVSEQALPGSEQDDVTRGDVVDRAATMTRTSPARMAGSMLVPETRSRTSPKRLNTSASRCGAGRRDQETFFTVLHWPLVGLTLPQARAIVSNTCSRTNAGFS